jgi:iron complex transport system ATP-binding protein
MPRNFKHLAGMHTVDTTTDAPLLEIDHASVARNGKPILADIDLRVAPGQHTAILGANGAGKSSLVQLIARQIHPLARQDGRGQVRVFGRDRWNVTELRSLLGIVSPAIQRDYTSDTPLEVFDAVVSGFFSARGTWLNHRVSDGMRERAIAALAQLDARHLIGREMASLSTGEARRVLIARVLVYQPRALLLDEPCAGLDLASRRRFLESLRTLARTGTTLLLVTHHIDEILPEIRHVVLLQGGRVLHQGDKHAMLADAPLSAVFGMPVTVRQQGEWYHAAIA